MESLLIACLLIPLVGALLVATMVKQGARPARRLALVISLVTLACVVRLVCDHLQGIPVAVSGDWIRYSSIHVSMSLGLDGLSLWMFGLTALLTVTAVLVSWNAITDRAAWFYALLLLLEAGMLGVFLARDVILFYVFFEFTLIPLYFIIGIWGSEDRRYAAIKFFLFTLAGSLLTFLGLLTIVIWNYYHSTPHLLTFSFAELTKGLAAHPIDRSIQIWLFLALFAGFAIKVPLFPFHTWLPLAHVQAPTAGSVILAGILLKIGTYGFLRFNLPMLPEGTVACMPWLLWLSATGIIYGALLSLAQTDLKKLIAYSSISHLGFCMLGIFAINRLGMQGGVLQMVNHGLSTGGLFALVGMIYERYHTRQISDLGGLSTRTPILATLFVVFTLSSIGLPGMNGFAGEFLLLMGMFERGWAEAPLEWAVQWKIISVASVFGVVLGAWYMLWLVQRMFFGPLKEKTPHDVDHATAHHEPVRDLSAREILALAPLLVFMFWIGLVPQHFLGPVATDLDKISQTVSQAFDQHYAQPSKTQAALVPANHSQTAPGELTRVD